jgi:urate oxidase
VAIVLGAGQYGKAEIRVLRVIRGDPGNADELRDLNVTVTLWGDLEDCYLTGDNSAVLTTDAQKNTVFAFAKSRPVEQIEDFALELARHFTASQQAISRARVHVAQYRWDRVAAHSFARHGGETRTATATCDERDAWVVSGLEDLVLLNTAGSEFRGFVRDEYTTLAETDDRILATAVHARWRHARWQQAGPARTPYETVRDLLVGAFAGTYSYSLQQTLFAMGRRVLEAAPDIAEVRLSLPNKHHFEADLAPFGMKGGNEVFYAADRPYGLIEGTVTRDDAPPAGPAW